MMIDNKQYSVEVSAVRDYFESFVTVFIFFLFTITFVLQQSRIPTGSMEDTILIGDRLLVNKFVYGEEHNSFLDKIMPHRIIERGDVVVFKFPKDPSVDYIKRVIGIGGDRVDIINKVIYVNGVPQDEPFVKHTDNDIFTEFDFYPASAVIRDNQKGVIVPEGSYFVMGDNRDNSNDSRFWGFVPRGYVKGKALFILWSIETDRGIATSVGENVRRWTQYLTHFFTATRWDRVFSPVR